ncbi:C13 family peptidase [Phenylobacterium soli]|uniref:Peptidase C13 n=1 Tax=Phenylobacterium soli TaxID=2170551 RepID=A0A328AIK7_9CAUL|nr:C13 family peptidase [Phenylobacterium soli]RAK54610.1 peptidase C13 [Phenylobacterium soli]
MRWVALVWGLLLGLAQPAAAASPGQPGAFQPSAFKDWAAVVVAGDWHAHSGGPSEAFDNARRDVARALEQAGFQPANLRQYSVRPERYHDTRPAKSDLNGIYEDLGDLTSKTSAGCMFYLSSHGSPAGAIVDDHVLAPGVLDTMLDRTCGKRPTVVVISACFSGVFVPTLARANRMVLTAARPDRSSFGCGEADKYPYFDDCFLQSMKGARDFTGLGRAVQACVAAKEAETGAGPPSEPQLFVGGNLRPILPLLTFTSAATH